MLVPEVAVVAVIGEEEVVAPDEVVGGEHQDFVETGRQGRAVGDVVLEEEAQQIRHQPMPQHHRVLPRKLLLNVHALHRKIIISLVCQLKMYVEASSFNNFFVNINNNKNPQNSV